MQFFSGIPIPSPSTSCKGILLSQTLSPQSPGEVQPCLPVTGPFGHSALPVGPPLLVLPECFFLSLVEGVMGATGNLGFGRRARALSSGVTEGTGGEPGSPQPSPWLRGTIGAAGKWGLLLSSVLAPFRTLENGCGGGVALLPPLSQAHSWELQPDTWCSILRPLVTPAF